jgi:eukaryotic-like serine/threonine-protein kinase
VESLLSYDGLASGFIDSPPALLAAEIFDKSSQPPLAPGDRFAHYNVERLLGKGGMGEVYLAADTRLQRPVALKVLTVSVLGDTDRLLRFEREAQAASALNHPNILTVHEFGEADGLHYIASEYVDGITLRQKLNAGGAAMSESLDIAIQVASALSAAHDAGITHRDIKPENIMIRRDGYVKVLDFGLAKLLQDEPSSDTSPDAATRLLQTEKGVVMGTDAYMSPEQARGTYVDARSDIWSLGVVLYEMLCGRRPFQGDTRADVIAAVLRNEPVPITANCPDAPAELEWVVSKALTKDVEARCQTSKELRADLQKIRKQLEFEESQMRSGDRISSQVRTGGNDNAVSTGGVGMRTAEDGDKETEGNRPRTFISTVTGMPDGFARPSGWALALGSVLAGVLALGIYFFLVAPAYSAPIDSIAVLPFANQSGDPQLDEVAEGLSETLIDRLAQLPQLKVIARNSSFRFRGHEQDASSVASQLGVHAVVTGSVTRAGDEIAVRIDVVDARDNRQLAGGTFRRKASDLPMVAREIALGAIDNLKLKLSSAQTSRLGARDTENSEAYRYYLNGLVALNGPDDVRGRALEHFQKAVELDPGMAPAYTEIAWIHWSRANGSEDPHVQMPLAKAAAERALALDPDLAKGHALQAMMHEFDFAWDAAEREYRRAIELSPNLDFARNNYAFFLSVIGRQDEALAQLDEQALRDPLNLRMLLLQKAIILSQGRRFDEALAAYQQAGSVEPGREVPQMAIGYAYGGKGQFGEAAAYYRRSVDALGGDQKYSQPLVYLAAAYARIPDKRNEARTILARIESTSRYASPALLAIVYAELGENDRAIELLEEAFVKRDVLLRYIGTGYEYDGLRKDPRFADIRRRVGV